MARTFLIKSLGFINTWDPTSDDGWAKARPSPEVGLYVDKDGKWCPVCLNRKPRKLYSWVTYPDYQCFERHEIEE